ncbi:MAG: sigma-70 family RNA polymerase sigma factor [Fodinibius sp.]|nr:sigma-70 family RNA polymerase sigma factor [Fodinibius sp.]
MLFDRYGQKYYSKCLLFVDSDEQAERLTHDIFLKVFVQLNSFDERQNFSHWLYNITYGMCMSRSTTQKSRHPWQFDTVEQQRIKVNHSDTKQRLLSLTMGELLQVLQQLPPDDRILLLMSYQDTMTTDNIRQQLGIHRKNLQKQLNRAGERAVAVYEHLSISSHSTNQQTKTNPFQKLTSRKKPTDTLKTNLIASAKFGNGLLVILDLYMHKSIATIASCFQTRSSDLTAKSHNGQSTF